MPIQDKPFYASETLLGAVPAGASSEWRVHHCVSHNGTDYLRIQQFYLDAAREWRFTRKQIVLPIETAILVNDALHNAIIKLVEAD